MRTVTLSAQTDHLPISLTRSAPSPSHRAHLSPLPCPDDHPGRCRTHARLAQLVHHTPHHLPQSAATQQQPRRLSLSDIGSGSADRGGGLASVLRKREETSFLATSWKSSETPGERTAAHGRARLSTRLMRSRACVRRSTPGVCRGEGAAPWSLPVRPFALGGRRARAGVGASGVGECLARRSARPRT